MAEAAPIVALFGYDMSRTVSIGSALSECPPDSLFLTCLAFTTKVRQVLKLKQISYTYLAVPTMMPRPILRDNFHLTYRKVPVLAIGREVYCDTSLIGEALEYFFPTSEGYRSIYPVTGDGRNYRPLIRGFASYWTDRTLFRVTSGLMPGGIWRSSFGRDRAQLIGHRLDPDKLDKKIPENLSNLDRQLSMLEPLFAGTEGPWVFSTTTPSLADISVYHQLLWGEQIASGHYVSSLTMGDAQDSEEEGMAPIFNAHRYPGIYAWFHRMRRYLEELPSNEVDMTHDIGIVLEQMKKAPTLGKRSLLLPTPQASLEELNDKTGIREGALVSVTPDDTGRDE